MPRKLLAALLLSCAAASAPAVDVNKATAADLDGINGIGPVMSRRILEERRHGVFRGWSDLIQRVKGIGPRTAERYSADGLRVDDKVFEEGGAPARK